MKKIVRLTETDLVNIIKKVIRENEDMMDSRKTKYGKEVDEDLFMYDPEDDFDEEDDDNYTERDDLDYADSIFYDEEDEENYV
jgi:hypothetical protein